MVFNSLSMIRALSRLPHIAWHLGRAGVLGHVTNITLLPGWLRQTCHLLDKAVRSRRAVKDAGGALCQALVRLGPGFVKFGQALSTRSDLIGPELGQSLAMLQDRSPWLVSLGRSICGVASGNSASTPSTTNFSSAVVISAASSDFMVILSGFFRGVGGTNRYYRRPFAVAPAEEVTSFRNSQALIWIDVDRPAQSVTVSRGFRNVYKRCHTRRQRRTARRGEDKLTPIAIFPTSHRSGQRSDELTVFRRSSTAL